jgi:lysophospholipase L1-like esterase
MARDPNVAYGGMLVLDHLTDPTSDARQALGATYLSRGSVRELFRPPILPGKRQPMISPPTVTVYANGTTTLTGSSLVAFTDPRFRYPGCDFITYPNWTALGYAKPQTGQPAASATNLIRIRFGFEGQAFEFRTYSTSGSAFRISINGQPGPDTWSAIGTDSVDRLVKVDLGARGVYDVMIEIWNGFFGGVRIVPTDIIYPSPVSNPLRMAIVGDSYTAGSSNPQQVGGYVFRLGELLGIEDIWPRGIGGTGYLTSTTFRSRLAQDVIPYTPDILMVQGSINDRTPYASQPGQLTTEINALAAQVRAALPTTLLVATGPLYAAVQDSNMTTICAEQKAAWQALGVPFIDATTWNTGTGNTSATTGNGTADYNRSADATHPTQAGYDHLAANLAAALMPIFRSNGATTGTLTR